MTAVDDPKKQSSLADGGCTGQLPGVKMKQMSPWMKRGSINANTHIHTPHTTPHTHIHILMATDITTFSSLLAKDEGIINLSLSSLYFGIYLNPHSNLSFSGLLPLLQLLTLWS